MAPEVVLTRIFEEQRERLTAMAQRTLGSWADAEDVVQETWLRLARQDTQTIDNVSGWLTTVVGRACIDVLRSRKAKREASYDEHLPHLVVTDPDDTPAESVALAESVGTALLVVLESLRPDERLAFVLHDMFAVPFVEIGEIIGKSTDAAKMLASRARRKVQGAPQPADTRQQREVVEAFLAAARNGDFDGLLRVLHPDVCWRTHAANGVVVRLGVTEVASVIQRGVSAKVITRCVLVDGEPGIMVWDTKGKPRAVMACAVVDGQIVEMVSVIAADKLAAMDLPRAPSAYPTT
ncbi:RNA polymerase subunit sigma-70 [Humibacillus sp. DSM 29435]|uniref:sigma-70 family RNA polymerase sigma factor n=1 Tax=Humibacillus sp. DSM 29435 TaxID=1869167 RepID=UPI000871E273|nr:sigma-70 family RNA polymerase sigma factor [Humibacillus sp. DSM 29435]OFE15600.1 RNA polymerase subunit sigma-70 [Humibacillus sp. DSM 29435]